MLTSRYMTSVKNLPSIMQKIIEGTAPDKFTLSHLKGIGFASSNDQGIIPLLKDLGFLTAEGTPTPRYHAYRDKSKSQQVLGEAIREAYEDIFHVNEHPTEQDRQAIEGRFKSVHNGTDAVAQRQAMTFLSLLKLADLKTSPKKKAAAIDEKPIEEKQKEEKKSQEFLETPFTGLRYNIEIHLPATKDVEVYNSIFKSLKEHLIND